MTTAALTNVSRKLTNIPVLEVVRGTCSLGSGNDWFVTRFGTVSHVFVSDETTVGGAKATFSGGMVTVNATASDVVTLMIFGN